MANPENKQIPYESTQKDIRDAIESVATAIGGIAIPSADHVSYDNSGSGLSATDVQNAIDELSSEKADSSSLATVATSGDYDDLINKPTIPTVNDATLTIQKNGSDVATFTANASSNVTANIAVPTTTSELTNNSDFVSDASYVHTDNNFTTAEKTKLSGIESGAEVNVQSDWNQTDNTKDDYIKNKPSSEVKSATDTFTTVNGGLLSKCQINLVPVQSGSGDPSPDNVRPISGHTEVDLYNVGKNKLPLKLDIIKSLNTVGTWSNNVYTNGNLKIEVLLDAHENVTGIKANGTHTSNINFSFYNDVFKNGAYYLNGISGGSTSTYLLYSPEGGELYNGDKGVDVSNGTLRVTFAIRANVTVSNLIVYPMLRLASESDPTFEPYLGHLYQVQIGQTVYGGYVDLVSGVMTVDRALITYDGSNDESWAMSTSPQYLGNAYVNMNNCKSNSSATSNLAKNVRTLSEFSYGEILITTTTLNVWLFSVSTSIGDFRTYLSNNPLQVVYELATPFTIQLTQQQIEALVGQNNLSTPLDGQSIDSVEYREVFVFDDVEKIVNLRVPISMLGTDESGRTTASQAYASGDYFYKDGYMCKALTSISAGATLTLNTNYEYSTLDEILESKVDKSDIYANAGSHNAIYRGKYLGSSVTAEQWSAIQNGTFDDLFIGDYWTINSVNWRIAHFNYWLGTGDTECTTHHVVIVPDTNLYKAKMNSTDITTGGYYNSEMRGGANYLVNGSSNLYQASETIKSAFGSSHILAHREMLTNAVSSGNASGYSWYDSSVELMSEVMVYGALAWSIGGKGYEIGNGKGQLALFRHDISKITNRADWWLRGVNSSSNFALVGSNGYANAYGAAGSLGVRPYFAIK